MKNLLALSIIGLTACSSSIALADTSMNSTNDQSLTGGMYIGGSLGYGGMYTPKFDNIKDATNLIALKNNRGGFTYRVDAGYLFPVLPQFLVGPEVGYMDYANNKTTYSFKDPDVYNDRYKYKGHTIDMLGVGKYYFAGTKFNMIGKVGAAIVSQKLDFNQDGDEPYGPVSTKTTKVLPELAVGVGYDVTQMLGVDVTYSHVFGKTPKTDNIDSNPLQPGQKVASINTILAGITYKFNL